MTTHRVTAGPYTLELPPNGVAILYEADLGGTDHRLPGGIGYLDALVQFAGEIIRLRAMMENSSPDAQTIRLTKAETQSGMSRVRWAENLIRQLPEGHDGRNSWLGNYGVGTESDAIRKRWKERHRDL